MNNDPQKDQASSLWLQSNRRWFVMIQQASHGWNIRIVKKQKCPKASGCFLTCKAAPQLHAMHDGIYTKKKPGQTEMSKYWFEKTLERRMPENEQCCCIPTERVLPVLWWWGSGDKSFYFCIYNIPLCVCGGMCVSYILRAFRKNFR